MVTENERERLLTLAAFLCIDTEFSPTAVIDSSGGIQALWATSRRKLDYGGTSDAEWELIDRDNGIIEAALGGKGAYNFERLLRLPGTINFPNRKKLADGRGTSQARLIHRGTALYRLEGSSSLTPTIRRFSQRVQASGLCATPMSRPTAPRGRNQPARKPPP